MTTVQPTKMLPPVWFVLSLIAMAALHWMAPVARIIPAPWNWLGLVPLLGGVALTISGAGLFKRAGTGIKPFSEVTTLVTAGPYRFTRNPMYLGLVAALIGVATLLGTLTPWLVVPPFAWWINRRFIAQEEVMLEARFGAEYVRFKERVRRWI